MARALAPVFAVLLSVALLLMGNGLQGTLLPVRAQLENFSSLDIGVLGSSYFVGFALGCVLAPHAVRRVGHIRAFTALVSIASTVSIAHALIVMPLSWWLLRTITGFCFAGLYMVIESWLNEKSTNETRGLVFSVYTVVNLTVITVGQMMLTLNSPLNFALFGLASILLSLAAVPVAMTSAAAPQPLVNVRIRPRYLFQLSPVAFLGCLAVGLANGAFWALGPVFAQGEKSDVTAIALFMSITVLAGAIGQYPIGRISDRMDRRKVIVFACLAAALSGVGLFLGRSYWEPGMFIFAALFGLFAFPIYALSVAHMNDFVNHDEFVEAASALLLVFALGAVIGPVVASILMRHYGVGMLFVFTAVVHAATALLTLYRMGQRATPPQAEHGAFSESICVAQTVAMIDPMAQAPAATDAASPQTPADEPERTQGHHLDDAATPATRD